MDLSNPHRRWTYILRIGGLRYRYTSGAATAATIEGHPTSAAYVDVKAIVGVGNLKARLDLLGGIEDRSPIEIQLASMGRFATAGDPGRVFSRVGRRAADTFALVTGPIAASLDPPFDVLVDRDLSGLDWPMMFHLNGELCYGTGADGSDPDPADADPFRITVTARGLGGTPRRSHIPQAGQNDYPFATFGDPVFWRGRPAILIAEPVDGSSAPLEILRGFLDSTPKPSRGGLAWTVALVPDSAKFDDELGLDFAGSYTRLTPLYHVFDGFAGSTWVHWQVQPPLVSAARDATAAGGGLIDAEADFVDDWLDNYDPDLPTGHPRAGDIQVNRGATYSVSGTAADGADQSFTLDAGPDANIAARTSLRTRPAIEEIHIPIVAPGDPPALLIWPGTADDGLDGVAGRIAAAAADTVAGEDGAAFHVTWLPDGGNILRIARNAPAAEFVDAWALYRAFFIEDGRGSIRPADVIARNTGVTPSRWADLGGGLLPQPLAESRDALWLPLDFARGVGRFDTELDATGTPTTIRRTLAGSAEVNHLDGTFANAWHQRGERFVLVEDLIDISSGEVLVDFVRTFDNSPPVAGTGTLSVVGIEPVALPGGPRAGETVYILEVDTAGFDFDFFDSTATGRRAGQVAIRSSALTFLPPGAALLRLLTAESALGLPPEAIDEASFTATPDPPWAGQIDLGALSRSPEELDVGDIVSSLTTLSRAAVVARTDAQGRSRLTRIPVGIESSADVVAVLGAGDWTSRTVPAADFDDEITNRVTIEHSFDATTGEFLADPVPFNDKASQAAHGERSTLEIRDFSGIQAIDPAAHYAPLAAGIFAGFAEPRTVYRGEVSTALALRCGLGAVVRLDLPALRDQRGNLGVSGVLGRVVEIDVSLWGEGGRLTIVSSGGGGAGWSVSCRVASVEALDKVTVDANAFAAVEGRNGAAQDDLDYFTDGMTVRCEPALNHDGGVQRTIAAEDGIDRVARSITFTAAHGLAVGDSIVATVRGSAPTAHATYAWLGDGAGDDETLIA